MIDCPFCYKLTNDIPCSHCKTYFDRKKESYSDRRLRGKFSKGHHINWNTMGDQHDHYSSSLKVD